MTGPEDYREELKELIRGKVLCDEELDRHTSIGVGGKADALIFPRNREELQVVVSHLLARSVPFLPVGNWTNLIVTDAGFRGALISLKNLQDLRVEETAGDEVYVHAGAGVNLAEIVSLAVKESLAGMEFCAGIPGSVGGALRMNAGAFGREMKDILSGLTILDKSGVFRNLSADDLSFSYRNLSLPDGAVIAGASFLLRKGKREEIAAKIAQIVELRKERHPLEFRNAGSIFKNPKGIPAGRIIDEMGLKGMQIGGARISERHGNFIVNVGHARARDILTLIDVIRDRVKKERGIILETEVRIIGE